MPVAQLKGFALAGTDGRYKWAEATVEGNKVVVWSEGIAQPTKFAMLGMIIRRRPI